MITDLTKNYAFGYARLSVDDKNNGESDSISNQRTKIEDYCKQNGIALLKLYADDGWSGSNFDRPAFRKMISDLEKGKVNMVITKDLSRLGRDMAESSYYAERWFPENGIHYIAIMDNFDSDHENIMAPFQFAMNEVYLRDGSRKVRDVLKNKREHGKYCSCPPYGYKKHPRDKNLLIPDEETAPVVQRIFQMSSCGRSCRDIALTLSADEIVPPLKYRVLYRDNFTTDGAERASDSWNYTTVKRILQNQVYLGHTLLGKSKKASIKSKKKVKVPERDWVITRNTHEPLVSQGIFDIVQHNLKINAKSYAKHGAVRKSIFGGIAFCETCGHALCSCGTVYKGEREKYWYLSCTHQRSDLKNSCAGARIKYTDLVEVVKQDLNALLSVSEEDYQAIANELERRCGRLRDKDSVEKKKRQIESRLSVLDKIIVKLYTDNASGKIDDERFDSMLADFESESRTLKERLATLEAREDIDQVSSSYRHFYELAKGYGHIDTLDRKTLETFVEKITVGPKILPPGTVVTSRGSVPFRQKIHIYYRFIGDVSEEPIRDFPFGKDCK